MIRKLIAVVGLAAAMAPATAAWAQPAPTAARADGIAVRADGLVATWYPPANGKRGPAILALGGSEGGEAGSRRLAEALAAEGYGVLALAYFQAPGLPQTLQKIPLEYFDRALGWLARQPLADAKRIGIYGISIGGETALVVAARHPEVKAVVAAVPSSVIWQGYDPANYRSIESTYSLDGRPVPYLAYDNSAPFTGVHDLYARSLAHVAAHPDAVIPVERIGGSVLLLSAKSDALWPSSAMSDAVIARLDAHHFAHPYRHIAYPDAGHGALTPPVPGSTVSDTPFDNLGGTPAGNRAARMDMWPRVVAFFDGALGKR